MTDSDDHAAAVDVGDSQLGDFRDAQAPGVGGHENCAVLDISDGCKEASDFVGAEDDRKSARLFEGGNGVGNVVAAQGDPVEESQGGAGLFIVTE